MQSYPFKQVDVFTATPYLGNPLAVVMNAGTALDETDMQRFAKWTNLSETTFILPPADPSADYRVRIFTPSGELPFAGHPTLGTCHAWLQAGGKPRNKDFIVQECKVGLVRIRREPGTGGAADRLAFAAPPLKRTAPGPVVLAQVAAALGLKSPQITAAQMLDNGPAWLGLLLDSPDTVLRLTPNNLELEKLNVKVGVAALYAEEAAPALIGRANREAKAFGKSPSATVKGPDLEVRAFAPCIGINEDPVTGSFNASLAQWLMAEAYVPERYVASQGVCLGRAGLVHLERDASGQVWVGGESVTCIDGAVTL